MIRRESKKSPPVGPTELTDPEKTGVSNSSIVTYLTGSVGIRSHLSFDGLKASQKISVEHKISIKLPLPQQ